MLEKEVIMSRDIIFSSCVSPFFISTHMGACETARFITTPRDYVGRVEVVFLFPSWVQHFDRRFRDQPDFFLARLFRKEKFMNDSLGKLAQFLERSACKIFHQVRHAWVWGFYVALLQHRSRRHTSAQPPSNLTVFHLQLHRASALN